MFAMRLLEEGANTDLSWLLLVGLAFFVLIVIVGWLVSRRQAEPTAVPAAKTSKSPAKQGGDDLTTLEGIGPKVVKVLNQAGILTFEDLAKAEVEWVQTTLDAAKLQMMDPSGWIAQAKLAAKGDMAGLAKLQDELKGGRRV